MCPYSCPWTTPACANLCLLTWWGCPCVAWRFSTNSDLWTSTTSRLLTLLSYQQPPSSLPPRPHFLWHILFAAGRSNRLSFSFSLPLFARKFFILSSPHPTGLPLGLWEGSVFLTHLFLLWNDHKLTTSPVICMCSCSCPLRLPCLMLTSCV